MTITAPPPAVTEFLPEIPISQEMPIYGRGTPASLCILRPGHRYRFFRLEVEDAPYIDFEIRPEDDEWMMIRLPDSLRKSPASSWIAWNRNTTFARVNVYREGDKLDDHYVNPAWLLNDGQIQEYCE